MKLFHIGKPGYYFLPQGVPMRVISRNGRMSIHFEVETQHHRREFELASQFFPLCDWTSFRELLSEALYDAKLGPAPVFRHVSTIPSTRFTLAPGQSTKIRFL